MEEGGGHEPVHRRRGRVGRGRRLSWLLVLLVLVGGGVFLVQRWGSVPRPADENVELLALQEPAGAEVTLYFADPRWTRLVAETRKLRGSDDPLTAMRSLVEALVEGPRGEGARVLPATARLRGVYLGSEGLAVIDFEPGIDAFEPGGTSGELLAVFALVHTLAENVPEVSSVQILVGGDARETLAGHVKISEPLTPDARWTSDRTP